MTEFQKSLTRFMYIALALIVVIAVLAFLRPPAKPMQAQMTYGETPQGVTATGSCVVRTKPELVEVSMGIRHTGQTAKNAHDYVRLRMSRIVKLLKDAGIAASDIQTERFSISPKWDSKKRSMSWSVEETLRVKVRKIEMAEKLVDSAVEAGANQVGNLVYTVNDLNELRAKGREKAARIAREKAKSLASLMGGKLGRLVSASEEDVDDYYWRYHAYAGNVSYRASSAEVAPLSEELTLQPGEVAITVAVGATYELE